MGPEVMNVQVSLLRVKKWTGNNKTFWWFHPRGKFVFRMILQTIPFFEPPSFSKELCYSIWHETMNLEYKELRKIMI